MADVDLAARPHRHDVLFYDVDDEVVAAVAQHVAGGLSTGEPVLVIATAPHLWAIDVALFREGVNVSIARASGAYLALDATDTLGSFMVDGLPDADRFAKVVGGVLDAAAPSGRAVRAFGEMVSLLWQQGNVAGAIALEALWNDLAEDREFSLLCAYPTAALHTADLDDVHQVCDLHSAVLPPSSYVIAPPRGREAATTTSRVFVAVPEAVAPARRMVAASLRSWGQELLVGDGALIVSELATNAIVHGGSPFRVSLERRAGVVRIAVEDAGSGLPRSRSRTQDALGGRGVAIVEELADRWGCEQVGGGKVFWAELTASSARTG